jgi:trehalose synthase
VRGVGEPSADDIEWLLDQSMLRAVERVASAARSRPGRWARPYGLADARAAVARGSVWFTAYPASVITAPGQSVLATLADQRLVAALAACGVRGVHTGPVKQAGGVHVASREPTPSIDGQFDRIGIDVDPAFGTLGDLIGLQRAWTSAGGVLVDDVIPAHTGKGPDFRLAERAVGDFPGLYHMVEIPPSEWHLLPDVHSDADEVNLDRAAVDALAARGHIEGHLSRTVFFEPGVKETDWSATPVVRGGDGIERRWVYLHYFKAGQPTLDWVDPSGGAFRLIGGDALHALMEVGAGVLRLDANGFLALERRSDGSVLSEGHPMAVTANELLAGMIRQHGGSSFQELNLTVEDIARMSRGGADLAYDFVTRPGVQHALLTGDTEFLRLMHGEARRCGVEPASLVHALQNHDELTIELVHFWTGHPDREFALGGSTMTGSAVRGAIRAAMYERLATDPRNQRFVENGVACTMASVATAALGVDGTDPDDLEPIRRAHLAMAAANALQPGVFAMSGWDLTGALPLTTDEVAGFVADGDTRWVARGAYDLLGSAPEADRSAAGMPRAPSLYGPLPRQLEDEQSFARRIAHMLGVRTAADLAGAELVEIVEPDAPGLLVLTHRNRHGDTYATVVNLGAEPARQSLPPGASVDALTERPVSGSIRLEAHSAALVRLA